MTEDGDQFKKEVETAVKEVKEGDRNTHSAISKILGARQRERNSGGESSSGSAERDPDKRELADAGEGKADSGEPPKTPLNGSRREDADTSSQYTVYGVLEERFRCECGKVVILQENGDMKCYGCGKIYDFQIKLEEKE